MLAHTGANTHKLPQNVLVIGDFDATVTNELGRHVDIEAITLLQSRACEVDVNGHENCTLVTQESVAFLSEAAENSYDLVIVTQDLGDPLFDTVFLGLVNRVLKDDGVFVMHGPNALSQAGTFEDLLVKLGEYYKIVMPAFFMQTAQSDSLVLASKKYHPTADLVLQRGDLIEGLQYYNCDLHLASFAQPNFIKQRFAGVILN
jgi:spermidine synthase